MSPAVEVSVFSPEQLEDRAAELVEKARAQVMMKHPLYASLLMRLKVSASWRAKTMLTDGRVMLYNPAFVCKRTVESNAFVLVHEVTHCALGHPMRTRNKADKKVWNIAADHAVNLILKRDTRLTVPDDATCDDQFEGQSADWIYDFLMQKKQQEEESQAEAEQEDPQQGQGEEQGKGGQGEDGQDQDEQEELGTGSQHGDVVEPGLVSKDEDDENDIDEQKQEKGKEEKQGSKQGAQEDTAPDEGGESDDEDLDTDDDDGSDLDAAEEDASDGTDDFASGADADQASDEALAREWAEALSAAALAAGNDADEAMERRIREALVPPRTFHDYLHQFLTEHVQEHEDWSRRNRRFNEVFVASRGGFGTHGVLFAIDTSGSINDKALASFAGTVKEVWAELAMDHGWAAYCDSRVRRVDEFYGEPEFSTFPGGGGTLFAPVFTTYEQMIADGAELTGIVFLTDQENFDGDRINLYSHIPTLWVNPGKAREAPFGIACSLID